MLIPDTIIVCREYFASFLCHKVGSAITNSHFYIREKYFKGTGNILGQKPRHLFSFAYLGNSNEKKNNNNINKYGKACERLSRRRFSYEIWFVPATSTFHTFRVFVLQHFTSPCVPAHIFLQRAQKFTSYV